MSSQIGNIGAGADRVTRAIAASARSSGIDFDYLLGQARVESGLNPNARAQSSSATGLYQFIDQSWLGVIDKHGGKYGLDWAANAISRDARGRLNVTDSATRQAILDLRKNPEIAAMMAGEFAADNRDYLEQGLGRRAEAVDLYLAHFLGADGARKFLSAHDRNPNAAAAPLFARAASANRNVFYDKSGNPRSFADIRNNFAAKLGTGSSGGNLPESGNDMPQVQPADYVRLASQRQGRDGTTQSLGGNNNARLAYLMLAAIGG